MAMRTPLCSHHIAPHRTTSPAQVIAQHLYQEGRFGTGDVFVQEARVKGGDALKEPFVAMHGVLCEVRDPACEMRRTCISLAHALCRSAAATCSQQWHGSRSTSRRCTSMACPTRLSFNCIGFNF